MRKTLHIVALAVFVLTSGAASAQFNLNTFDRSKDLNMPLAVKSLSVKVDVVNDAKARALRREAWRARNLVDTKVTFTGAVTRYNDAWASNGGLNSISGTVLAYYYHTYSKNRYTMRFNFDGQYGMNLIDDVWFKNQDLLKLYFLSSWDLKDAGRLKNWAYSLSATFSSQFSEGYKSYTENDILWSNFLAPATLNGGLGFTYTSPEPKLPFIVTVEPISGNVLFVADGRIDPARRQSLGIPVSYAVDDVDKLHPIFKNYKAEGGSKVKVTFNRTFRLGGKGFTLQYNTDLSSFYGWITNIATRSHAGSVPKIMPTLGWTNTFNINPLSFLTLQLRTTTIYDRSQVDKVQMQYFVSVGLSYGYRNRK